MTQSILDALHASTAKRYFRGTHRARDPAETLAANRRHMPALGITRIANITGLDRIGLPVCVAIRPNSRSLATSQGKGETIEAAMVSALMESLELWHAERIGLPVRIGSHAEIARGGATIDMAHAPVRSDATYDPARCIPWVEGFDLIARRPCWVPYELVSINLVRQAGQSPIFLESTNGLSSGNHLAEAMVHALAEVIERDAMSLWELYSPTHRKQRQVDLATVEAPALRAILDTLHAKGIVVGAWDVTSDIGVPTFSCVILEDPASPDWRPIPAYFGAGTHLDPAIALSRAVNEAIQSRLTAITGSRDDIFQADYVRAGNREDQERIIAHLREPAPRLPFQKSGLPVGARVQDDLRTLLEQLRKAGIGSAVAVDLTRPELGVPVVKVVVPELEPYLTPLYRPGKRARRLARELAA
ncbi:MAG TPA: YcaO-like family protein [Xanthomonadaceae bacterium]|nr:YcaO-like family protein [Xanthomonadaceae bacterium]